MKRKLRLGADPMEGQMELALNPGVFIPDRACYAFITELEEVAAGIGKLAGADPVRATALYETFLAGCYEKAEELDDSSGSFGQFAGELICGWIKARQASGAEADETAAILLARMDDDPYGFCYQIEKDAAKAFDKAGLAAFERQIQARFEAAATVRHIRAAHHRKTGFMPGFEALAARRGQEGEPSFLERAKTRWGVRHGRGVS